MIDSYISDMTDYIAPENETTMMRVDRNDIWWNYKQIEGEATSFDWIVQDTGSTLATYKRLFIPNPFSSDEENEAKKSAQQQKEDAESARRQRNYEKLQGFRLRTQMIHIKARCRPTTVNGVQWETSSVT